MAIRFNLSEEILYIIWLSGVIFWAVYYLTGYYRMYHRMKRWSRNCGRGLAVKTSEIALELELKKVPEIRIMESSTEGSFTMGIIKNVIYLPDKDLFEKDLQYILKHELIHCKEKDIIWKHMISIEKPDNENYLSESDHDRTTIMIKYAYPDRQNMYWVIEEREYDKMISPVEVISMLKEDGYLPQDMEILNFWLDGTTAYIDLSNVEQDGDGNYRGDGQLQIYLWTIINSLCINDMFRIENVYFLVDHDMNPSLGMLDTTLQPFKNNLELTGMYD